MFGIRNLEGKNQSRVCLNFLILCKLGKKFKFYANFFPLAYENLMEEFEMSDVMILTIYFIYFYLLVSENWVREI